MTLADADRLLVTTFAGGVRASTAEWVVGVTEGSVGFWTPDITSWVSRLEPSDVVSVQAADGRGRAVLDEPVLEGRARMETAGATFDDVREATRTKYRIGSTVADMVDAFRDWEGAPSPEGVVVIRIVG